MARKATAVVEEYEEEEVPVTKSGRRVLGPRGHLQDDVKKVIDGVLDGSIELQEDNPKLTPHRVATLVAEYRAYQTGVDAEIPSTGAVSAVFSRWADNGIATFTDKPKAFKAYTAAAKRLGVSGVMQKRRDEQKAEKAALKAAANGEVEVEEKPKRAPRKRAAKKAAVAAD